MLSNHRKTMALAAIAVVVLLAAFGIDRIGGETWVSVSGSATAGFRAGVRAYARPPVPVLRRFLQAFLLPLLMLLVVVATAGIGAILNRYSNRDADEAASGEPQD